MVRIHSTIGDSGFNTAGRNFVVEDESISQNRQRPLESNQIPQNRQINPSAVAGMRRKAMENQELVEQQILTEAKHRVEIITGLGRKTKDVVVDGTTFTLRSLKTFEQNCLSQVIAAQERINLPNGRVSFTPIGMYAIKTEALSHSLYLIDNQPISVVLGTVNYPYEEQVIACKDLITEMDGALTDYLFLEFEKLSAETQDGYAPKSTEEVKEVVDTIRKSGQDT
jgi:hypothetical protein